MKNELLFSVIKQLLKNSTDGLPQSKVCSLCSRVHAGLPENARPWLEEGNLLGFFWECRCTNTLFFKVGKKKAA